MSIEWSMSARCVGAPATLPSGLHLPSGAPRLFLSSSPSCPDLAGISPSPMPPMALSRCCSLAGALHVALVFLSLAYAAAAVWKGRWGRRPANSDGDQPSGEAQGAGCAQLDSATGVVSWWPWLPRLYGLVWGGGSGEPATLWLPLSTALDLELSGSCHLSIWATNSRVLCADLFAGSIVFVGRFSLGGEAKSDGDNLFVCPALQG